MDCIIQVFPDDFHLQTLETLLGACPQLQPTVDIKTVMSQLMERLSKYAAASPDVSLNAPTTSHLKCTPYT
jgi:vacuolar protein sorting-associated protein 35